MSTIESRISEIRQNAMHRTFMRFGDRIPMCSLCTARRVEETGDICRSCVEVMANRRKIEAERQQAKRQLALIGCGIIVFLICAGGAWVWLNQ